MEIDPEGVELAALGAVATFTGARVLEIGCGNGRLAKRYAVATRLTVGIDPADDRISAVGMAAVPALRFVRASVPLPFRNETFDVALFGWSL
jgi:ubiquinone/menaquinone biosynthesis C-methylase UbiE